MTPVDAARLRALAEKATPGPWFVVGPPWNPHTPWVNAGNSDPHAHHPVCDFSICEDDETGAPNRELNVVEDATYIAAVSPDRMRALLDALKLAREAMLLQRQLVHDDGDACSLCSALARMDALAKPEGE